MNALILAAGKGSRLKNLTSDRPKAMVNVAGRPLIDYVLDFLDHPSIEEIAVVTGYQAGTITAHLKGIAKNIRTYFNELFHEGSIRSIMTAQSFLDTDFILLNADHIYSKKMMDIYLFKQRGLTVACDFDRALGPDDMKIKKGPDGYLTKIRKDLSDFDGGYIGSTYVPKEKLGPYKKALVDSYEIYGKASNAETAVGHMAANDHKISIADLSGIGWLEVDTPEEAAAAENKIRQGL